jgi:hypothetical protein
VEPKSTPRDYQVPFAQIFPFPQELIAPEPEMVPQMINDLPPSLKALLTNVKPLATPHEIQQSLDSNHIIRMAINGGAIPGRASYGWILQIGNTPITKGKGPAYGDDPRSFHVEGYGMASGLLFLQLLQCLYEFQRGRRTTNIIICDNEGLLTRIEEASQWTYTMPNVTLRAEWDIESVILDTHKELNMKFVFMHVKSHQDGDTPAANLTLEMRLNVEAN